MIAADTLRLAAAEEVSILDIGGGSGIYSAIWLGLNPPHARPSSTGDRSTRSPAG